MCSVVYCETALMTYLVMQRILVCLPCMFCFEQLLGRSYNEFLKLWKFISSCVWWTTVVCVYEVVCVFKTEILSLRIHTHNYFVYCSQYKQRRRKTINSNIEIQQEDHKGPRSCLLGSCMYLTMNVEWEIISPTGL